MLVALTLSETALVTDEAMHRFFEANAGVAVDSCVARRRLSVREARLLLSWLEAKCKDTLTALHLLGTPVYAEMQLQIEQLPSLFRNLEVFNVGATEGGEAFVEGMNEAYARGKFGRSEALVMRMMPPEAEMRRREKRSAAARARRRRRFAVCDAFAVAMEKAYGPPAVVEVLVKTRIRAVTRFAAEMRRIIDMFQNAFERKGASRGGHIPPLPIALAVS